MGVFVIGLRNEGEIKIEADENSSFVVGEWPTMGVGRNARPDGPSDHLRIQGKNADAVFHQAQWAYLIHKKSVVSEHAPSTDVRVVLD